MANRPRPKLSVLFLAAALSACATAGNNGIDSGLITAEEIDRLGPGVSAFEAIERLRPVWLRDRGMNSMNPNFADDTKPKVHVDMTPYSIDDLRSFRGSDIQSIRFMEGRDATTRFGTGYVNGLIVVTTRNARGGPGGQ